MVNPELKIVTRLEVKTLFNLIMTNTDRLIRYFPLTAKNNTSIDATRNYIIDLEKKASNKEMHAFGIYNQKVLIGMVFIKNIDWRIPKCELGYFIDKEFEGKGIMSKIIKEALYYCFKTLNMVKVYLKIGMDNEGSKRIAIKNGFVLEGVLQKEFRIETNELIDVEYYGKLNTSNVNP